MDVKQLPYFLLDTSDINTGVQVLACGKGNMSGAASYSSYHSGLSLKSAPARRSRHHPPLTTATRAEVAFQVHAHLAVQ